MGKAGILFDLDGVLYQGDTPITGAAGVVQWCQHENIPFLFLTNTTSRPRTALVEKLAGFGINITVEQILTPPIAACHWLQEHDQGSVALFVPKATRNEFDVLDIVDWQTAETVGAIIIGDLGSAWDFNTLNAAFRLLMHQPQPHLVALGLTRYWQAEDGLRLDTGPFVKALEYATGQEAVVLGKPAKPFFLTALQLIGLSASKTIMIGDDIRGDIDAAQQCGIAGLLVRTGKFRSHELERGINPHAILDSVADLPAWWTVH
jgi:phospholysine phosphohistidine inorganic pyrophosphate phosphatase